MPKQTKTVFVCNECGNESAKWMGKCPACGSWNSFFEQKIDKVTENGVTKIKQKNEAKLLNLYKGQDVARISTGFDELDRVLGGGLVKGEGKVLYVSGEESAEQIKLRADRLKINNDDILFLGETDIDIINENIENLNPKLVIIDSIQTMYSDEITAAARKCKSSKRNNITNYENV